MAMNDRQRLALARAWREALSRVDPAWTDSNAHEPGVTLLEVVAYALDDLAFGASVPEPAARALARRIVAAAGRLAGAGNEGEEGCGGALVRVRYFHGQLLTAEDLEAEQHYFRTRLRRRNRWLHGAGVVSGLEVSVEQSGGGVDVRVGPGFALDPAGEEIHVVDPVLLPVNAADGPLFVLLRYAERPCDPRVRVDATADDRLTQDGRVAESFALSVTPSAAADAVALARLVRENGQWRVDPEFSAARVR